MWAILHGYVKNMSFLCYKCTSVLFIWMDRLVDLTVVKSMTENGDLSLLNYTIVSLYFRCLRRHTTQLIVELSPSPMDIDNVHGTGKPSSTTFFVLNSKNDISLLFTHIKCWWKQIEFENHSTFLWTPLNLINQHGILHTWARAIIETYSLHTWWS